MIFRKIWNFYLVYDFIYNNESNLLKFEIWNFSQSILKRFAFCDHAIVRLRVSANGKSATNSFSGLLWGVAKWWGHATSARRHFPCSHRYIPGAELVIWDDQVNIPQFSCAASQLCWSCHHMCLFGASSLWWYCQRMVRHWMIRVTLIIMECGF